MKGEKTMVMTTEELCEFLGISKTTLTQKFKRTQQNARRNGYIINKKGRGKTAMYEVNINKNYQQNAEKIFDEAKQSIIVEKQWVGISQYEFNILLYLLMNTDKTFRGTYRRLLTYMDVKENTDSRNKLKEAIKKLVERKIIWNINDEDVIVLILKREAELNGLLFDSEMIGISNQIAQAIKTKWTNVLKVWLACRIIAAEGNTITGSRMKELTGLGAATCNKCLQGLSNEDILRTKKLYASDIDKAFVQCLGREVEMNKFYN